MDRPMKNAVNPGSDEAHQAGCICPNKPNQDGQGAYGISRQLDPQKTYFVIDLGCPMHGAMCWGPPKAA